MHRIFRLFSCRIRNETEVGGGGWGANSAIFDDVSSYWNKLLNLVTNHLFIY